MPERTVRIAFRGLMVLNYQGSAGSKYMEIGLLDARTGAGPGGSHVHTPASSAVHIPRVMTMENGVLADLVDLRAARELGTVRNWTLNVNVPGITQTCVPTEATVKGLAPPTSRLAETPLNREDFGWIIDLENSEMHDRNLTGEISTAKLLMVLKVERGEFFTKLLSPTLIREKLGGEVGTFGLVAAVTGLDIKFNVPTEESEAQVQLLAGQKVVKTLKTKKDTRVFEISNGPADVPAESPIHVGAPGHFHMYYDKLFNQSPPSEQFDFRAVSPSPGPDPALCGVTFLGKRDEDL